MKQIKNVLLTAALMLLVSVSVFAQERRGNPEERMKNNAQQLKTALNLNEEQAKAIEEIHAARVEKFQNLRSEEKVERSKHREEMKALQEEYDAQVLALLDAEQKAKYEALKEERKSEMREQIKDAKHKRKNYKKDDKVESES